MSSMYMPTENFIQIAMGNVKNASHINKFGYNTAVGSSYEPITDLGTNHLADTATVVTMSSVSSADTLAGSGARTVSVQGLDANYNQLTETVNLNGTSNVTTTGTFLRVFRMRVESAGADEVNQGNITASIGGTDVAQIQADQGQTLMAVYTVPRGYDAYLLKFQGSLSKNQEANFQFRIRNGEAWNVKGLWGTFAQKIDYDYPVPLKIKEMHDIQVRGKAGATSEMGAIFDLILVKR